jgi:hypothetical protein
VKRDGAPERHRAPFEPGRFLAEPSAKLEEEAGLADPRLPSDEDHLPMARLGLLETFEQEPKLALSAHKGRQPPLGLHLQARAGHPGGEHLPGADRLGLPFQGEFPKGADIEVAPHQAMDGVGNQDATRVGRRLEAGRYVRRVPHRGVVHAQIVPDASHHYEARVETLPHLETDASPPPQLLLIAFQRFPDPQGRMDRALGVVLMRDRGPKERHDSVPEELIHGPFVAVHLGQHQLEGLAHQAVDVFRVEPLREGGEPRDVHEEDRHLLALPFEGAARGQDLFREVFGGIGLR